MTASELAKYKNTKLPNYKDIWSKSGERKENSFSRYNLLDFAKLTNGTWSFWGCLLSIQPEAW